MELVCLLHYFIIILFIYIYIYIFLCSYIIHCSSQFIYFYMWHVLLLLLWLFLFSLSLSLYNIYLYLYIIITMSRCAWNKRILSYLIYVNVLYIMISFFYEANKDYHYYYYLLYYSIVFIESMLCIVCILYSLILYVQCIALLIQIRVNMCE